MLRLRTDSRRAFRRGTGLALALCLAAGALAGTTAAQTPPIEAEATPPVAGSEEPAAQLYLGRVLRDAARANRGRRLRNLARTGRLRIELPESGVRGALTFEVALLPDGPGRAVRLAGVTARAPIGARPLDELRLAKPARRRLARLWVAAIEVTATFTPDSGGVVHDRVVFLTRR